MAFRPNYQQQRGDRTRAKERKKAEKLQRREEDALRRKAERDGEPDGVADSAPPANDETPPETT